MLVFVFCAIIIVFKYVFMDLKVIHVELNDLYSTFIVLSTQGIIFIMNFIITLL